jgi:hypothetical protein
LIAAGVLSVIVGVFPIAGLVAIASGVVLAIQNRWQTARPAAA